MPEESEWQDLRGNLGGAKKINVSHYICKGWRNARRKEAAMKRRTMFAALVLAGTGVLAPMSVAAKESTVTLAISGMT